MSSKLVASKGNAGSSTELKVEQLRRENAELYAALEARTQENILLNEVISTVGSTLKLDEVLGHLVDTIVRAISCHAVFFYLYEKDRERLVLASTNEQYKHLVGKIGLALGEGITGWDGLHLLPLIGKEAAMNHPRLRYFPQLEGEQVTSTTTLPITRQHRHLIG